ncbi:PQQ-like beta-propeller repeat protein [Saccharothrix sp. AJ9571]|nr:PQQ-like beta-propeller repeat protein [Saccharothrix sp. AJ9571]
MTPMMGAVVAALAAACAVVALFLPGDAIRPDWPEPGGVLVAMALAAVALLALGKSRANRWTALGLATAAAAWAVYCLVGDLRSGTPGSSTGVLAVAAVVGLGAALTLNRSRRWPAVPLVVVLAAGTVTAVTVVPGLPVRSATAAPAPAAPMADHVSGDPWSWTSPTGVREVVAAGTGVAVAGSSGDVTALDGPTGAVRWTYARPGAHVRALVATPDRALLLASYAPGGGRDTGSHHLVVLDAFTGVAVHDGQLDEVLGDADQLAPTASVLPRTVHQGEDDFRIETVDLRTGAGLWTWSAPDGCDSPFALPASGRDVVLAPLRCDDRIAVLGLDERTGVQRWEFRLAVTGPSERRTDYFLHSSPGGETLSLSLRHTQAAADVLLDAATGAVTSTLDSQVPARVELGPSPLLERTQNGETLSATVGNGIPVDLAACDSRLAHATTVTAYWRLCSGSSGPHLHRQALDGSPALSVPVAWPALTEVAPSLLSGTRRHALVPAPGALVVVRAGATPVLGFP